MDANYNELGCLAVSHALISTQAPPYTVEITALRHQLAASGAGQSGTAAALSSTGEMDVKKVYSHHFIDTQECPAGGVTYGRGFTIAWQNGPLGRGDEREEPNGAFVEDIILAARDRLQFYQAGQFACDENKNAIESLTLALGSLKARTERRVSAGVEGTHEGN